MKKILYSLGLLFLHTDSFSQIGGNAIYNGSINNNYTNPGTVDLSLNSISNYSFSTILEANVMINVKASSYVAIFSISQQGKTIEEVEGNMKARIEMFKNILEQEHVNATRFFVDPISLVPTYEMEVTEKKFSKTVNEIPAGFEIKKNVHITFKTHDEINSLIAVAAKAEIYDMVKVDYAVDNLDVVLSQIRQEALRILLNKKKAIEAAGLHARFTQVGEKYGSVYPIERYAQYYAYKTGMAPSYTVNYKKGQAQQVAYNYAEKNKTIYYDKVADKQFDLVINSIVTEPMVQVYLTLKGEYQTFDPETEAADKAHNEKLKQLQLKSMELDIQSKQKDIEMKGKKIK